MNTGNQDKNRRRSPVQHADADQPMVAASTATVELALYAGFAEWLDRDLARLEDLYKSWATAGYGQWRRSHGEGR